MMRVQHDEHGARLWVSADDTARWADGESWGRVRAHGRWPCSTLRGRRLFAAFDARNGDLVEFTVNGGRGSQDVDVCELNALVADVFGAAHPIGLASAERAS